MSSDFKSILEKKKILDGLMDQFAVKLLSLKREYETFSKNTNEAFVFGVDSLIFQFTLLHIEFVHFKKHFSLIKNRVYCENYKLHKLMMQYMTANCLSITNPVIEPYLDLEPFREYNFDKTAVLHTANMAIIKTLHNHVLSHEKILQTYATKQADGLNIDNFASSAKHKLDMVVLQVGVFENYILFINKTHIANIDALIQKVAYVLVKSIARGVDADAESSDPETPVFIPETEISAEYTYTDFPPPHFLPMELENTPEKTQDLKCSPAESDCGGGGSVCESASAQNSMADHIVDSDDDIPIQINTHLETM